MVGATNQRTATAAVTRTVTVAAAGGVCAVG